MDTLKKLNYDALETLLQLVRSESSGKEPDKLLEVVDVDVKRLHDDRSEIQLGQEVAFVATFAMRITQQGVYALKALEPNAEDRWQQLAHEDKLLEVGADAELRSDVVPIDEDSVALWIKYHYRFTFLLNGKESTDGKLFSDVGRVQLHTDSPTPHDGDLALPWLQKLNVGHIQDDYIDVDVRIDEIEDDADEANQAAAGVTMPSLPPVDKPGTVPSKAPAVTFTLEARIDGTSGAPSNLIGRRIRLVDADTGKPISFVLTHAGIAAAALTGAVISANKPKITPSL